MGIRRVMTEREFIIDNLLVRIHRCFWWTGLAPWEFEFPFPGSLISAFLELGDDTLLRRRIPGRYDHQIPKGVISHRAVSVLGCTHCGRVRINTRHC